MATSVELDPVFRQALRYLHSSQSDAAENIRKALDDVIKLKHGSSKMLINTLSKKHIAEECKATGSGVVKSVSSARRSSHKSSDSSSNSDSSPVQIISTTSITTPTTAVLTKDLTGQTQEIPLIISIPDSDDGGTIGAVDDNAMDTNIHNSLFEDLACVICRRIDLSAKNRLIECTKCNSLYHQECHSPQIKDLDLANGQESSWLCIECKGGSSTATSVSSSSSSSSKKEEKKHKDKEHSSSSSSSKSKSRHHSSHHSSSHHSSHSSKHERSSGSGSDKNSSKNSAPHPKTKILSRSEKSKSSRSSRI